MAQSQTIIEVDRINISQNIIGPNFQPDRFVNTVNGIIFLDIDSRQLGLWSSDSIKLSGGYGTDYAGMFDPVDFLSNQLDIYLLDGAENKITRYDNQLNFIQSFPLTGEDSVLPSFFTIESRQNFYFYSFETNNIYRTRSLSGQFDTFLDLTRSGVNNDCIVDFKFSTNDNFILLFDCLKELYLFSRSGKLVRRFPLDIKNPIRAINYNNSWFTINRVGMLQFIDKDPIELKLDGQNIIDAIFYQNLFYVLTESELIIFEIINSK